MNREEKLEYLRQLESECLSNPSRIDDIDSEISTMLHNLACREKDAESLQEWEYIFNDRGWLYGHLKNIFYDAADKAGNYVDWLQ